MACKYNGKANHPRDESYSDEGSQDRHEDKKQRHNEMQYSEERKNRRKSESSPSTLKSPHGEGGSQISGFTNHGSATRALKFDSLKRDTALRVDVEVKGGEYNLKLTSVPTENTNKEHAHTAAMLMSQGELLRKLGEKLLSQLGMSYESEICRSLNLPLPY